MDAIGYVRISVKDQSTYSIDGQKRSIQSYCAANGLTLLNIFTDDGESSYSFDRPDWKALELFIRKNKSVSHLIIFDHDRFSRNLAEALMKIKELHDKFDIKVLATTDNFNTDFSDPSTFMMRAFKYMMAEGELHRIRSRTQAGYVEACLKGFYVNRAPWGYKNCRINERPSLTMDEERAPIVRMIFQEYTGGASIEEIRKLILVHSVHLKGNSSIQRILSNPTYAGLIKVPQHKGKPETVATGIHQGIVSEETYYKAIERLTGGKRVLIHSNAEVPLKGVLKGPSGKLMSAGNSKGKYKYYWYYVQQEDHRHLSAAKLHAQLGEMLDHLSFSPERIAMYEKIVGAEIQKHLMSRAQQSAQTNKALRQIEDKILVAEEKWLTQPTSKTSYAKVMNALSSQRSELLKRMKDLEDDGKKYWRRLNMALPKLHDVRSVWEALPLYQKQQFLNLVFDSSLTHDGTTYRTLFLHPVFSHNVNELEQKKLLILEKPSGITPVRSPIGSLFEQIFQIFDLLAA
jgi:site-specific DNA recombinase